jgi:hypothetical protein
MCLFIVPKGSAAWTNLAIGRSICLTACKPDAAIGNVRVFSRHLAWRLICSANGEPYYYPGRAPPAFYALLLMLIAGFALPR